MRGQGGLHSMGHHHQRDARIPLWDTKRKRDLWGGIPFFDTSIYSDKKGKKQGEGIKKRGMAAYTIVFLGFPPPHVLYKLTHAGKCIT